MTRFSPRYIHNFFWQTHVALGKIPGILRINCGLKTQWSRFLLASLSLGLVISSAPAAEKTISFDGQIYYVAFHKSDGGKSVTEYLPKGGKLDSWVRLVAIRTLPGEENPKLAALGLVRTLKLQNPQAQSAMMQHPSSKDVIVDFVTWPQDGKFIEFNIFRYSKLAKNKGLLLQQYAQRAYGDKTNAFLASLGSERQRLVNLMVKDGLIHVKR